MEHRYSRFERAKPWLMLLVLLAVAATLGFMVGRSRARPVYNACIVQLDHGHLWVPGCTVVK